MLNAGRIGPLHLKLNLKLFDNGRQLSALLSTQDALQNLAPPQVAELLAAYAQHAPRSLTLGTLLSFGHPLTPESVLASVSYAQAEIPRRLPPAYAPRSLPSS